MATQAAERLDPLFRGHVIRPGDPDYNEARMLYNAMIDKHPAIIARPVDAADVISAVGVAPDVGLEVAVRAAGTTVRGLAVSTKDS